MKNTLSLLFFLNLLFTHAQDYGSLDWSFNSFDTTMYHTQTAFNGALSDFVEITPGEFIVVGAFTRLHDKDFNKIAKISGTSGILSDLPQYIINGDVNFIEVQLSGKLILAGSFDLFNGISTRVVRLNPDFSFDFSFLSPTNFVGQITDLIVGPDDGIFVTGYQMYFDNSPHNGIFKLLPDGAIDNSFNTMGGSNGLVTNVEVLQNGKLLINGFFSYFGVTSTNGYCKLLANGSIDPTFNANLTLIRNLQPTPSGDIFAIKNNNEVIRLHENGLLDFSFSAPLPNDVVGKIALKSSGGLYVYAPNANSVGGVASSNLYCLNNDGIKNDAFYCDVDDFTFFKETSQGNLALSGVFDKINNVNYVENFGIVDSNGFVITNPLDFGLSSVTFTPTISMHGNDKIMVGGHIVIPNYPNQYLAQYNLNGAIDSSFMNNLNGGPNGEVSAIFDLSNGQVLIGGYFSMVSSHSSQNIARINQNGTVDLNFVAPNIDGVINSIDIQPDGKILIAGSFLTINGVSNYYVARLNNDGSFDNSFNSPFFDNVTFNMSAAIIKYTELNNIYVGGRFACCSSINRLHSNGAIDVSFDINSSISAVSDLEELPSGDVIFGGIGYYRGVKSNGQHNPSFVLSSEPYIDLYDIDLLSNSNYLLTGSFDGNQVCKIIDSIGNQIWDFASINSYNLPSFSSAIQNDGKIVSVGLWSSLNNARRNHIARINPYTLLCDTICYHDSYVFGSTTYDNPTTGFYYDTITSSLFSDSIILLHLIVNNMMDIQVSQIDYDTLFIDCPGCNISWINCQNQVIIPNENSSTFFPMISGEYAAVIENNGCIDTTDCFTYFDQVTAVLESSEINDILIFPNPVNDWITVKSDKDQLNKVIIIDIHGNEVLNFIPLEKSQIINISQLEKGVYFILISTNKEIINHRFVKS